jgi:predicted metal-dependent phosphoesterase TrpH
MKIDLHCHSHYSDGKHSPGFLVQLAIENRVSHLAITDHDCIAGISEAVIEVEKSKSALKLVSGVEISCDWEGSEIHVLGLWFDPRDRHIGELLSLQQDKRRRRVLKMHELLQSQGDYDLMAYLNTLPCHALSRSHVADYLVNQGICKNRQKAFKTQRQWRLPSCRGSLV